MKCHAGAGHPPAADRGAFGWLCDDCHERVIRLLKKNRPTKDND
jgi:hypothetical protein